MGDASVKVQKYVASSSEIVREQVVHSGGGEGHSPIGQKRGPQTVYGKAARGVRTRQPQKWSNKFIIKSRRSA